MRPWPSLQKGLFKVHHAKALQRQNAHSSDLALSAVCALSNYR